MTQWLGKFIESLSKHAKPTSRLKRKETKFEWNHSCRTAFNEIKNTVKLAKPPNNAFYVTTDASDHATNAVLGKMNDSKKNELVPVEFMSKQ